MDLLFHLLYPYLQAILASSSWDRTVLFWGVFDGKGLVETFSHTNDVLTIVYCPDGKYLASSTLDGQIHLWDPIDGLLMYTTEGRRDIAGRRLMTDSRKSHVIFRESHVIFRESHVIFRELYIG